MTATATFWRKFARAKRGATAVEYGLLLGLIAIVMLGAVSLVGDSVITLFQGVSRDIPTAEVIAAKSKGGVEGNCGDGAGEGSAECDNK